MILHTLDTGEQNDWMRHCLPTLFAYAARHGYGTKVWGPQETKHLSHPKFIVVRILEEFLASDHQHCLWVDADVWIHPKTPAITKLRGRKAWNVAQDAWHIAGFENLVHWVWQQELPDLRDSWVYRNAGVWMCNRWGAKAFLKVAKPPYRVGVMDQNQMNVWWSQLPEGMVEFLPVEWNRAVKQDLGFAWFQHLCGSDKMDYWETLVLSGLQKERS